MAAVTPREGMTLASGIKMPTRVRIERYSPRRARIFIDGEPFPWTTSPVVERTITDCNGVVDVTFAIRAVSAEIVNVEAGLDVLLDTDAASGDA